MSPLWQLVRERFPLRVHLPMVAVFTLGNVSLAGHFDPLRFAAATAIALLYFFRLRCFDEIKDLPSDRRHHPERPLARGLVSPAELGRVIVVAMGAELALAVWLAGLTGLLVHTAAQGYSLLMYREFFVGRWLRPRLTTYAITHTLSAALLAAALGLLYRGGRALSLRELAVIAFNWCLFNLFEFARKTWAPAEERQEVDSYSRRFGVGGAVVLGLSQVAGGMALLALHPRALEERWAVALQAGLALLPVLGALALAWQRRPPAARLYRRLVSVYLVLFYAAVAADLLSGAA
jgi:4-hydroxybenzoate polyprenyltransferase